MPNGESTNWVATFVKDRMWWVRQAENRMHFAAPGHLTRFECLRIQKEAGWDPTEFGCGGIVYHGYGAGSHTFWRCMRDRILV